MLRYGILGSVELRDGERRLEVGGPRQVSLLAFLLVHANRAVSSDRLIDALWPELGATGASQRLRVAIGRLRKTLDPGGRPVDSSLRTVAGGYLLAVKPGELDAEIFEAGLADGRGALERGEPERAGELLGEALAMWRGPALADVAYRAFAQGEIRRLEELRLAALEARIEADLELGRHAAVIAELEALSVAHPTRERLAGQLMLALYRCGRQADALEVYQRTRSQLAGELGLDPGPALQALQRAVLEQALSLEPAAPARTANQAAPALTEQAAPGAAVASSDAAAAEGVTLLPRPVTPTFGRELEVRELSAVLAQSAVRLVTLTGPGGVGKTRLALVVAQAVRARFLDGVGWVELAGVARADDVASTLTRVLAITPVQGETAGEALKRVLAAKRLLLVIDNFEHVLDAAGLVADLIAACPGITVLVTSREALDLSAEHRVVIAPLRLPETATLREVERSGATALFVAAACRHDSRFRITAAAAPAIVGICARLDGLPLAIELAAARTELMTVQQLAARLDGALSALGTGPRDAPERQRTLGATIQWSHRLLDDDLKAVFARFAVFAGGATLEAAEAVTAARPSELQALIAKHLLYGRAESDGQARLAMLETVRGYALERLAEDPQHHAIRRRHCEYYSDIAARSASALYRHGEADALRVLDRELDNIRAALGWALEKSPADALRIAGRLHMYWRIRGAAEEGLRWLDGARAAAGDDAPIADRAQAELARAFMLWMISGQAEQLRTGAERALNLHRRAGEDAGITEALYFICDSYVIECDVEQVRNSAKAFLEHASRGGDELMIGRAHGALALTLPPDECRRVLQEAATFLHRCGSHREVVVSYSNAAYLALVDNRVTDALTLLEEAGPDTELIGERTSRIDPGIPVVLAGNLGLAALFAGDHDRARRTFTRQLALCEQHGLRWASSESFAGLAALAADDGELERAARLVGAANQLGPIGHDVIAERLERDFIAPARDRYGHAAWNRAKQAGARMSFQEAIAYAVAQDRPRTEIG